MEFYYEEYGQGMEILLFVYGLFWSSCMFVD